MFNKRVHLPVCGIVPLIFTAILAFGFAISAQGQGATKSPERGFHAGGSYALSEIETISRSSGELSLSIPIGSLPAGRNGFSASLRMLYSSKLWDTAEEFDETQMSGPVPASRLKLGEDIIEDNNGGGGWRYGFMYQLKLKRKKIPYQEDDCQSTAGYVNQLVLVTPDGAQHVLRLAQQQASHIDADGYMNILPDGQAVCAGGTGISGTISYYTTDSSYLRLDIQADTDINWTNNFWTLSMPDGTKVLGGTIPGSTAFQQIKDRNGNTIEFINKLQDASYSNHQTTTIKDLFNRSMVIEYNAAPQQDKIHIKGTSGHELLWVVQWRDIKVRKNYQYSQNQTIFLVNRTIKVLAQITLPQQAGNLNYTFDYNACDPLDTEHCNQGNNPSAGWGELSRIILPSGATAEYQYVQDNINGTTGSLLFPFQVLRNRPKKKTLTYNTVYEGTAEAHTEIWDYLTTYQSGSISEDQPIIETRVTGPDGGISYEYPYKTSTGAYVPEETVKTINADGTIIERLYGYNAPPNSPPTLNMPNRFVKLEFTSLHDLSKTAIREYSYDGNGNVLTVKEYDWVDYGVVIRDSNGQPTGSFNSPAPMLLRKIVNTYHLSDSGTNHYSNPNSPPLRNALKSTEVQDGSGTVLSYSEFTYDSPTTTGNLTQSKTWDSNKGNLPLTNPPAMPNYISTTNQYDSSGNLTNAFDGKGYQTKFTYDANQLYPTRIEKAFGTTVQLTIDKVYDFSTGLETEVKDVDNDVKTTTAYDDFGRPTLVKAAQGKPEESQTETVYDDVARYVIVKSDLQIAGDKKLISITHYDQLGRVRLRRSLEDVVSGYESNENIGIKVQTRYTINAPYSYRLTSNPYRADTSSQANQEETMGWTLSKTHNNGRASEVESFNGEALPQPWGNNTASTGKVITSITANTTTVTDQALKKRRSVVDGLGRLVRVDETSGGAFDGANGALQPTRYTYDALDNLIKVEQSTQASPVITQTRRFAYDSLKRLISAANPEQATHSALSNWAVKYEYDNNSNLIKKTDSRETSPNNLLTTSYDYDALNRITTRSYANDPQGTPQVTYEYDDSNVNFAQGRLTKVTTAGVSTTAYLQYDRLGRVLQSKQTTSTPDGSKDYPFSYEYNRTGALTRELYPSGKVVATEYGQAGRIAGVKKEGSTDYYVGAMATDATNRIQYAAHGAVKAMKLGNGLWEHTNFNGRLQPVQIGLGTSSSNSSTLQLDYTYHTTTLSNNNGNVRSQHIVVGTMDVTQTYEYDELNRLQSAEEKLTGLPQTSQWKQTFSYDRFGNRKFDAGQTTPASVLGPQLDFSASNNRITTASYDYDSAGNVKQEPASPANKSYAYDGENHQVSYSFNGATTHYVYDGDGKRVMKWDNSGAIVYVYDALGRLAAEYTTNAPQNNGISYLTTDHLGSTRVVSGKDGSGNVTIKARYDYLPFGEEVPTGLGGRNYLTDNTRQKFTGHERDAETKLDFAQARYCSPATGRFMSADPIAMAVDRLSDPQRINLYAYTQNNPLRFTDPTGETISYADDKGASQKAYEDYRQFIYSDRKKYAKEIATIERLEKSGINYIITLGTKGFGSAEGHTRPDDKGNIIIGIRNEGFTKEKLDLKGRIAHELEHGRQFDTGEITFYKTQDGIWFGYPTTYDVSDEVNAFNAYLNVAPPVSDLKAESVIRNLRLAKTDADKAKILLNGDYSKLKGRTYGANFESFESSGRKPGEIVRTSNFYGIVNAVRKNPSKQ